MDNDEEFFSPQALRLLAADSDADLLALGDSHCLFADDSSVMQPQRPQETTSKTRSVARGLPGTSTFCVASNAEPKPKRVKFEPERRIEVARIRKRGACLRCRVLKIAVSFCALAWHFSKEADGFGQCSGEVPCKACIRSSSACRAREPKYRWMHCVPFSLKEIDVFALCKSKHCLLIKKLIA